MSFVIDITDTGGTFTPVPPGIHLGVCLFVCDIGTHITKHGPKKRLLFTFEIPALTAGDGKPMQISRRVNVASGEKSALRPFLTSWLGQPAGQLDLAQFAGKPAMLVVSQSANGEKVYSNITACAPVAPGTPVPPPSTPAICYGPNRDPAAFAALPEWVRTTITAGGAAPVAMTAPVMAPAYPQPVYQAPAVQPAIVQPQPVYQAPAVQPAIVQPQAVPQTQTAQPVTPEAPFNDALTF